MFLVIFEDGSAYTTEEISPDIKDGAEDGILDLFQFYDHRITRYVSGEFQEVDSIQR